MNLRASFGLGLVVSFLSVSGAGCGGYYGGGPGRHVYAHAYGGAIPLTLVNDTPVAACYVHMGPSADRNWGDDWLGRTEVIPSGNARTFQVAGGYTWDIRVNTCEHTVLSEAQRIPVLGPLQLAISSLRPVAVPGAQPQQVYVQPPQQQAPQVYVQPGQPGQPVYTQPQPQQPGQVQVYVQQPGTAPQQQAPAQ